MFEKGASFNPVKIPTKTAQTSTPAPSSIPPTTKPEDVKYLFNKDTPIDHTSMRVPPSIRRKAGIAGAVLSAVVIGVYAFTISNMKQQDFSDVIVPEHVREKFKYAREERENNPRL
jgi:hypothetical protein